MRVVAVGLAKAMMEDIDPGSIDDADNHAFAGVAGRRRPYLVGIDLGHADIELHRPKLLGLDMHDVWQGGDFLEVREIDRTGNDRAIFWTEP